jgi:Ca2+-transporting ATPase
LRLRLSGLYRSPSIQSRVERTVLALEPVTAVRANTLTGTALILFNPQTPLQELLHLLEQTLCDRLTDFGGLIGQRKRSAPTSGPALPHRSHPASQPYHQQKEAWHARTASYALAALQTDPVMGLSRQEAGVRLLHYGPNTLGERSSRCELTIFLSQFKSLPVAMLSVSAAIAIATGGVVDAGVIIGVVLINAIIGYITESQAEKTIAELGRVGPIYTHIVREGKLTRVPIEEVVPGDIIHLSPGSPVAADARLLSDHRLSMDESALTGESMPETKHAESLLAEESMLGDRDNMIYMGTLVTGGDGVGVVVNTAAATELGQIQALVDTTHPPATPMEQQLGTLGTQLGLVTATTCAAIFGIGLFRGEPWLQMLNSAVSLAVAAVPEGLPAVATTTLALGIHEMNKRQVAVRKLEAVESLGSLQTLCLDKTGTLTANHMTVVTVHCAGRDLEVREGRFFNRDELIHTTEESGLKRLLEILSLCNEVTLKQQKGTLCPTGSPTEVALVELALGNGIDVERLHRRQVRILTKERSEGRPWMMTKHRLSNGIYLIAIKGSPLELLERSVAWFRGGRPAPLLDADRRSILNANERMAANALRVLGVAYRISREADDNRTKNLIWIGLVGMQDPLRPGMPELMHQFHLAGIKTCMITGDQSATAYAIARELSLNDNGATEILDSAHLDKIDPELLAGLVRRVNVFSRVSPTHKLRIVQALQQSGQVVAMTGDGINDGPALKSADIGIAMGSSGSDVARAVSDVVLEDDNLHTMAEAILQGRTIYSNIRKSIHFLLSTNFSEVEVMFWGITLGLGQLLNPMQLLWINLVTDIFPALALSLEPPDDDLMYRPPRPAAEPIITLDKLHRMAGESTIITAGALGSYFVGRARGDIGLANTMAFHSLTLAQLLHATACRSDQNGLFNPLPKQPRNPWLEFALVLTGLIHLTTQGHPGLRRLLGTKPMGLFDVGVMLAGAIVPLLINERLKARRAKRMTKMEGKS